MNSTCSNKKVTNGGGSDYNLKREQSLQALLEERIYNLADNFWYAKNENLYATNSNIEFGPAEKFIIWADIAIKIVTEIIDVPEHKYKLLRDFLVISSDGAHEGSWGLSLLPGEKYIAQYFEFYDIKTGPAECLLRLPVNDISTITGPVIKFYYCGAHDEAAQDKTVFHSKRAYRYGQKSIRVGRGLNGELTTTYGGEVSIDDSTAYFQSLIDQFTIKKKSCNKKKKEKYQRQ